MRDTKSLLLLLVSLLLVLVSFVLIWTWGYSYYNQNNQPQQKSPAIVNAIMPVSGPVSDSLQKLYTSELQSLDFQLDATRIYSDSLKAELDVKLAEFYRLRAEIALLLKSRQPGNNYAAARQKLGELQAKVDDLKFKNLDVEAENKKLNQVLNTIVNDEKSREPATNNREVVPQKPTEVETPRTAYQVFSASNIKLTAVGDEEKETNEAAKVEKLNGAFTVVNFNSQLSNAEIMVVLLKPDGRTLKVSDWDAGTFNTASGKKVYSYKFSFNYTKGDAKRLNFSLQPGSLNSGNYTMEVYYNGVMIGRTTKLLS